MFRPMHVCIVALSLCLMGTTASAVIISNGGVGAISFGVAPVGFPVVPGAPTFIPNNLTGLPDILTSPGNGWLTANTSIDNNITEIVGPVPGHAVWVGGGNNNGPFGGGAARIDAAGNVGFSIFDSAPAGGSASYVIASSVTNHVSVGGTAGTFGAALGVRGRLLSPASSLAVSLTMWINDTAGVFDGIVLPPLVLAAGSGLNNVAQGGFSFLSVNHATGDFAGVAFNVSPFLNIPAGTELIIRTTLTAIADPSELESLEMSDPDFMSMVAMSGGTLADINLASSLLAPIIPTPGAMSILAFAGVLTFRRRR